MKLLPVFCALRKAEVYINPDKIVLLTKAPDGSSLIELEGDRDHPVQVAMTPEDLVRKINGEDKAAIGFRTGR